MQENAFHRVRNQKFSGRACPGPTWTVLAPSALGPPNLKHLPTALPCSISFLTCSYFLLACYFYLCAVLTNVLGETTRCRVVL